MSDRSLKLISTAAAWLFGLFWALPLLYAIWAAVHARTKFSSVSGAARLKLVA